MTVELDLREKSRPQCSRLLMSATSHGQRLAAIHKAGFLRGGVQRGNLTLQGGTGKLRRRLLASRSSHGYEEARHLLDLACRFSSGHCMAMEALLLSQQCCVILQAVSLGLGFSRASTCTEELRGMLTR